MGNSYLRVQQKKFKILDGIFKRGSTTYYNATKFFPRKIRVNVTKLYAFVRTVDSLVDQIDQNRHQFDCFYNRYQEILNLSTIQRQELLNNIDIAREISSSDHMYDYVILTFVDLMSEIAINSEWIEAFFNSMRLDFTQSSYNSIDELLYYIFGSAEVIGLCMARIMNLPDEAQHSARMLGRSMQYINFIRDIREDNEFKRRYIPVLDQPFSSLKEEDTRQFPRVFEEFIRSELRRFESWQREAELGFQFLSKPIRVAIKTASEMYLWSAEKIAQDPWIVYQGSVKPPKIRIFAQAIRNLLEL